MYNYHTHTQFCDGSSQPVRYVEEALRQKMQVLGFSAHAPLSFENEWSLKKADISKYVAEIERLKTSYKGQICILNGLEADYIPGITQKFDTLRKKFRLDYIIGSVHLVKAPEGDALWFIDGAVHNFDNGLAEIFNHNIRRAVTAYYKQIQEMIVTQKPDIIGHIDKIKMNNKGRFFSEDEGWYEQIVTDTLYVASRYNCLLELNTRGVYTGKTDTFFPSPFVLERCLSLGIKVMVNSDAHRPEQLTLKFKNAFDLLKSTGFKNVSILDEMGRKEIPLTAFC
ncbi:MAG: Histidinol-phosphatase [Bacteroidetes bacterium ADurb.Bin408]|nr:MAG: Histidinol-phosphatase [Bacteroidetes bacterium ADurb.Bin408]